MERHSPLRRRTPLRHGAKQGAGNDAERRLWSLLRNTPIAGLRFRHREIVGPYTVAFFCPAAKLVLELDGDQQDQVGYDQEKAEWLRARGYRVLRLRAHDVMKNPRSVIDAISQAFQIQAVPRDPSDGG